MTTRKVSGAGMSVDDLRRANIRPDEVFDGALVGRPDLVTACVSTHTVCDEDGIRTDVSYVILGKVPV